MPPIPALMPKDHVIIPFVISASTRLQHQVRLEKPVPLNIQFRERKSTQQNRIKQWRSRNVLYNKRPAGCFNKRPHEADQIRVGTTPSWNAIQCIAVSLAWWTCPNEIEAVQVKRTRQHIRLNERIPAVPRLGFDVHSSHMKPRHLQAASRATSAAEEIKRPQL